MTSLLRRLRNFIAEARQSMSRRVEPAAVGAVAQAAGVQLQHVLEPISQHLLRWSRRTAGDEAWPEQEFAPLQPDLEDILLQRPPRFLRGAHYTVAILFLLLVLIACVVKVDTIVVASGRLIADAPLVVVQPMQLSIIRTIKVRPGEKVRKGDVLATLDPTFTQADRTALLVQKDALDAQIARLEAELNGTPLRLDTSTADRVLQLTLYQQRASQYASHLRALDEEIERFSANIHAAQQNMTSLNQQLGIAKEVEAMRAKLFSMQAGSRLNYLDAQAVRLRNERDSQDAVHRLDDLRHALAAKQAERQVFIDEWRRQILEDLVKARNSAASLTNLVKAQRMNDLVVLTAPADGIVLDIAKKSVGSVTQAAEPIVTLVPTTAPLIAEVMINSGDVGFTRLGDDVAIKVDAFAYQQHGMLHGKLRAVGEDSVAPGGANMQPVAGQSNLGVFHRSQIELTTTKLANVPDGSHVIPGMSVTAEIKVGSRSVISYFLYPIERGLQESIREP